MSEEIKQTEKEVYEMVRNMDIKTQVLKAEQTDNHYADFYSIEDKDVTGIKMSYTTYMFSVGGLIWSGKKTTNYLNPNVEHWKWKVVGKDELNRLLILANLEDKNE
jgi:hypothetical protein